MPYISVRQSEGTPDLHIIEVRAHALQVTPSLLIHMEPVFSDTWKQTRLIDVKLLLIPCHPDDAPYVGFRIEG